MLRKCACRIRICTAKTNARCRKVYREILMGYYTHLAWLRGLRNIVINRLLKVQTT